MLYSPGNLTSMDLTAEDRPRTVRFLSCRARAQAQGKSERRIAREEERRERKRVDDGGRRRKGESSTWESEQTTAVPSERVGAALAPARSRHRDPSRLDPRLGAASVYFLHRPRQKNDFVGDHCDRRCVRPLHSATSSRRRSRDSDARRRALRGGRSPTFGLDVVSLRALGDRSRGLLSFLSILLAVLLSGLSCYPSSVLAHVAARLRHEMAGNRRKTLRLSEFQQLLSLCTPLPSIESR